MAELTTTQQIWRWLGSPPWPPPPAPRGKPLFGTSDRCWLCGGSAGEEPHYLGNWLRENFTGHQYAKCPSSDAVCQACVYLTDGDSWREYCAAHPEMGLKSMRPLSWRSYGHVFAEGLHVCPVRGEWRQWLVEPPDAPFVVLLPESAQKHIVFLARVSTSRYRYWLQLEEDTVLVDRADMAAVMELFERLLALGFTRDEIVSGRYQQGRLLRAGLKMLTLEDDIAQFRRSNFALLRAASIAAHGPAKEDGIA